MRVASFDQFNRVQLNIGNIQNTMASQQFKMSTGKQFDKASEDPIRAKQVEVTKFALNRIDQYSKNANDAKGILETQNTVLMNAYNVLDRVNQETVKAKNDVYNQDDLNAIAAVVDNAIDQMVSIGNTKHLNRYIFAGEKIQTKPFDYDGTNVTYNGNDNDIKFEISPYISTTVHESGNSVFTDTIKNMVKIRDQIKAGDKAGLSATMTQNQNDMANVMNHVAQVGVRMESLNVVDEGFQEQRINLEARRSNVEDVDFTKLVVDYSITQQTYQSTLKASAMMFQSSILDYI